MRKIVILLVVSMFLMMTGCLGFPAVENNTPERSTAKHGFVKSKEDIKADKIVRQAEKEAEEVSRRAQEKYNSPDYNSDRESPHCVKGCPCGNSCISCLKTCRIR